LEKTIKKLEKYNKINEQQKENAEIEKQIKSEEKEKLILEKEINIIKSNLKTEEKIIEVYEEYLEKIKKNNDMNNKLNEIKKEMDKIKNMKYEEHEKYLCIQKEKEKIIESMKHLEKCVEMCDQKIKTDNLKLEIICKRINEYDKTIKLEKENEQLEKTINKKEEEINSIKGEEYKEYNDYKQICESINLLEKDIYENNTLINELNVELESVNKIQKEIEVLKEKKKTKDELTEKITNIIEKHDPVLTELNDIRKQKHSLNHDVVKKQTELSYIVEFKKENKEMYENSEINKQIIDIIKNGFVDDFLTNKIIPAFCDNVNSILNSYVNFHIFMSYTNKKITVYKKDKNDLLTNALKMSGYETLMTNIAFRLAINNVNKLLRTNFFVIDEAFSFCDENSISKIQNLFDYMRKIYTFVIVISHNEQIKAYTDIDIPISHTKGFSKIYFVNEKQKQNKKINVENDMDDVINEKDVIKDTKRADLTCMTKDEQKEHKKEMKKSWDLKNKERISEYNKKKYNERKSNA